MPRSHSTLHLLLVLGLAAMLLVACSEDEIVNVIEESPISVSVTATPTEVDTGEKVSVKATATAPAGVVLSYSWIASGGGFSNGSADSTGWTAPDEPGLYTVSVIATDADNVAIGSARIAVATYMPTETPFYVGASACALCHDGGSGGSQYTTWVNTAHAGALSTLQSIGQGENAGCLGCHTVGTYGLNADVALDNGGYDENAVPRLGDVQCENCHGPGSEHPQNDFTSVQVSLDAAVCGVCHTDAHHPTYDEWQTSGHSGLPDPEVDWVASAARRASCAKCHNGTYAAIYLDDPAAYSNPAQNPTEIVTHTCAVCHDPHGNENPGYLRNASVTDVYLPNNVLIEDAGAGRLCISCHNGRRAFDDVAEQIELGSDHFGPHHSNQGDMLKGANAYEDLAPSFTFASSKHILVEDACVTCHTHPHEGDLDNGIPNFTGHTFEPTVEACASCHGDIADFDEVIAKQDYDGDLTVEGVQDEVEGLMELLKQTIIAESATQGLVDEFNADFEGTLGDATKSTREQREAGYNWAFVDFDGSTGVHNTTYAVQIIQQSILYLDAGALPSSAYLLVE